MRILFLDDEKVRRDKFRDKYLGTGCIIDFATNAKEAIDFLKNHQYDFVSLDHDLGGKSMVESNEESGYAVAEFIAYQIPEEHRPKKVVIHSFNPVGAQRMYLLLKAYHINVYKDIFKA